jgi:hypothetical protein
MLCAKCSLKNFSNGHGKCSGCGNATFSRAFKYCGPCSQTRNICAACSTPITAPRPASKLQAFAADDDQLPEVLANLPADGSMNFKH